MNRELTAVEQIVAVLLLVAVLTPALVVFFDWLDGRYELPAALAALFETCSGAKR